MALVHAVWIFALICGLFLFFPPRPKTASGGMMILVAMFVSFFGLVFSVLALIFVMVFQ